jgi:hypothetical protein
MGTAGTPPDCAQCETGYVPPRRAHALAVAKDRACLASAVHDVALVGLQRVCWCRTYSDVEGLPQCVRCPGDKNYTLVKVFRYSRAAVHVLARLHGNSALRGWGWQLSVVYVSATKPTPKPKQ